MERVGRCADVVVVHGWRRRSSTLLGVLLVVAATAPAHGEAARPVAAQALAPGLTHEVWTVPGSAVRAHVARRDAGSPVRLQVVQAHDAVVRGLETTSSMCRRTAGCQVAVNGDFFLADGPVGGVVSDGRMLRSPRPGHEQLSLEPLRATTSGLGEAGWAGRVAREGQEPLPLDGVNVALRPAQVVLYTSQYGAATPACTCLEVELADTDGRAGSLDRPASMTIVGRRAGSTPLRPGTAVLAGEGPAADALSRLAAARGHVTVSVTVAAPTAQNLGVHPVLLSDGQQQQYDEADPMLADPHPRTVVGWNAAGTSWFVTVDGRRPHGPGMTAAQVVAFLRQLGATEAVLLDGGGSTTFVRHGRVVNDPSERQERPVANAVVLVWEAPPAPQPPPPPESPEPAAPVVAEQAAPPVPVVLPVAPSAAPPARAAAPPAAPDVAEVAPVAQVTSPPRHASAAVPPVARRLPPADDLRPFLALPPPAAPPRPPWPGLVVLAAALCAGALAGWLRVVARWPACGE